MPEMPRGARFAVTSPAAFSYNLAVGNSEAVATAAAGKPIELDVAVVGAGPAGASAALALGGCGLRVGLIEKANPPRYKTCGGGVLRRAIALLPIDVGAAIERECHTAELVHHAPNLRFLCERERPVVSMVMRDRFDHLIATAAIDAGARLFAKRTVLDVQPGERDVRLATSAGEFRARFVIAADGVNSIVARKTGRPELRGVVPAFECEVTLAPEAMAPFMRTARFDFGLVPAGYGWVFPKRAHLSIGVGTTRRGAANLPAQYRRYLDALGIGAPLREERHGYMIPCRPRAELFGARRVLFAGDAAGLADPVTAEGITAGILSGQLAARAILAGEFDEAAVKRAYRRALEEKLLAELRVARWLAWILYDCPRLNAALLTRHGQGMSELMTRIVTGETTYRAVLRRPGNYLKLLRRGSFARVGDRPSGRG
ncbi:MAG TPA: geranylgeranyl reductase family protein [Opitutaceae bacterium]|nr:geranylgeranyl reductase family protein [Opitutaceae bacterium]